MNPFAKAWADAARDLNIRVIHPFVIRSDQGQELTTVGAYLPDFGSPEGTLLTCRFDSNEVLLAAESSAFYQSHLNPESYEPYERATYIDTLNDWGWYGRTAPPDWYTGRPWGE